MMTESHASNFGPVYTITPRDDHSHTVVMLHGRGSTGQEYAEELLESTLPGQPTIVDRLPTWKFVFPSSK